jgi:hypothetical protein
MDSDRFGRWLRKIHQTQDEEISCTECFDLVSGFVELELSGEDAAAKMPHVIQHLLQCDACHEEYETLRDLRRLDEQGGAPWPDDSGELIP